MLGAALAGVSAAWAIMMYLMPDAVGHALLRRSWNSAHAVILPYGAVMAAAGSLTGATVGLRALAAARRSLQARIVTGVLSLITTAIGAYLGHAAGSALGLAVGLWIGSILWWTSLRDEVRATEARRAAEHSTGHDRRTRMTAVSGAITPETGGAPGAGT
jgi:putative Mn2+ efflux pump MntP